MILGRKHFLKACLFRRAIFKNFTFLAEHCRGNLEISIEEFVFSCFVGLLLAKTKIEERNCTSISNFADVAQCLLYLRLSYA